MNFYRLIFMMVMAAGAAAVCYGYVYGGAHILLAFAEHKGIKFDASGDVWQMRR